MLPTSTWMVTPVEPEELGPYILNDVCAAPDCGHWIGLEDHHIWSRSFLKDKKAWWVTVVSDDVGQVVAPNRVALCPLHHLEVTGGIGGHKARIVYEDGTFYWQALGNGTEPVPLAPQPGPQTIVNEPQVDTEATDAHEHDHDVLCPKCHGKGRVPKPREREPQDEEERPSPKNFQLHIPKGAQPDGWQNMRTLVEHAQEKVKASGYLDYDSPFWSVMYGLAWFDINFDPERERREGSM